MNSLSYGPLMADVQLGINLGKNNLNRCYESIHYKTEMDNK